MVQCVIYVKGCIKQTVSVAWCDRVSRLWADNKVRNQINALPRLNRLVSTRIAPPRSSNALAGTRLARIAPNGAASTTPISRPTVASGQIGSGPWRERWWHERLRQEGAESNQKKTQDTS